MTTITLQEAIYIDLSAIVELIYDDEEAKKREVFSDPILPGYVSAFNAIQKNPNVRLITVKKGGKVIGVAQLNFIVNLTYQGGMRAQVEGVRIHKDYRSQGIGAQLFEHLIKLSKQNHCHLVQLTTSNSRNDAHRFYKRLGFECSHAGYKLHIKEITADE